MRAHLNDEYATRLKSYCAEAFGSYISVLATLMKKPYDIKIYYETGVLDVLCQCATLQIDKVV